MGELIEAARIPMRKMIRFRRHSRKAGFTLIELVIAGAVLVVGVLAMSGLVAMAVAGNGRSRLDSTATMLTQAVVEQVNSGLAYTSFGGTGTAYITDCGTHNSGNPWHVASNIGGAPLLDGRIDFSQAVVDGYHMDYVVCNGNIQTTYDVRWNISPLSAAGTSYTHILTVGARMKGGIRTITFPINMRVMLGPDPAPAS